MVNVLVRHKVANFEKWKATFDEHFSMRKAGGELNVRIFHNHEDPTDLTLLMDWETLEKAQKFINSDVLKNAMNAAGVSGAPTVIFLDEVRVLRRTSAD